MYSEQQQNSIVHYVCKFFLRRFFTLIELLTVISIIAVLTSLLLPALNKAKGSALRISCLNNVKGYAVMMIDYANSYSGYIPSYYTWFQRIQEKEVSITSPINANIYRCPAYRYSPKPTDAAGWGYSRDNIPYGLNMWIGRKFNFPGSSSSTSDLFKINEIKRPSKVIMIGDSDDDGIAGSRIDGRTRPLGNRHGVNTCVVKVDGHTELLNTVTDNVCLPDYGSMDYSTGASITASSTASSERWSRDMFYRWGYWHSSGLNYLTQ